MPWSLDALRTMRSTGAPRSEVKAQRVNNKWDPPQVLKPWGRQRAVEEQQQIADTKLSYVEDLMRSKPASQRCDKRVADLPRPRVYVYELPPQLLPPPQPWRQVRALKVWVEASRFYEPNPFCADYFLVPSHPQNRELSPDGTKQLEVGDLRVAEAFGYIRDRYPFWNKTVRAGTPRHLMLLPCDHGPGDCAFSRPNVPYKHAGWTMDGRHPGSRWWQRSSHAHGAADIERTWGESWEYLNPASPARLVIFLMFNGWTDQLRARDGACLNCFAPGLDIRLPSPEGHECGVSCGLHMVFNASSRTSWFVPIELQRELLRRAARRSPSIYPQRSLTRPKSDGCLFSWAGAVRGRNSPARWEVLKLIGTPGACVTNTIANQKKPGDTPVPSIPTAMLRSRFCFSPRGWDQGDSDRYLPAIMYGCVPVMSDRLEGMPLDELPEMKWGEAALAIEREAITSAIDFVKSIPPAHEAHMRNVTSPMLARLLYTTFEFSQLPSRAMGCVGCAKDRSDCRNMRFPFTGNLQKRLPPLAHELKIDVSAGVAKKLCGKTSYFDDDSAEDGSRDAFHGVMEVLRLRMERPHDPLEPWAREESAGGTRLAAPIARWPLQRAWFAKRAEYLEKLARTYEPRYTLLRAPPPAHKYRKEAAASTHGSYGRPMKPHAGTLVPHQPRLGLAKKQLRNEDRKSSQHRP